MSIATRIENMSNNINKTYNQVRALGADLTNIDKNLENLPNILESIYNNYPKTPIETGTSITLNNTTKGRINMELIPQTSQETMTGKNQIGLQNYATTTKNGLTFSVTGDEITINGTATAKVDFEQLLFNLSSNTTKTLSFYLESGSFSKGAIGIHFNEINDNQIAFIQIGYETTDLKGTKTISLDNIAKGWIYAISGSQFDNATFKVMLSDNADDSYEPFTGGIPAPNPDHPEDIHCTTRENQVKVVGKNIFNKVLYQGGINENTGEETSSTYVVRTDFIKVANNENYTLSFEYINVSNYNFLIVEYDSEQSFVKSTRKINRNVCSIVSDNRTSYLRISFYSDARPTPATFDNFFEDVQLENNSTATSYLPYEETTYPISLGEKEMSNISNVSDGFVYDETTDKFYIERQCGKFIANGSENWTLMQTNTETYRFVLNNAISAKSYLITNFYCNRFQKYGGNQGIGVIDSEGCAIRTELNGFTIRANISRVTNLAGFKTWLSNNNTIFIYQLATSILEEITDSTLISQLRAIKNALSMQETTHIISTSNGENLPFIIKANALLKNSN